MVQAGTVGVVGMAVAAQMFLKVQTIAASKCYHSCSKHSSVVSLFCVIYIGGQGWQQSIDGIGISRKRTSIPKMYHS